MGRTQPVLKAGILFIILMLVSFTGAAGACTIWGATGDCTRERATLVTKSRDWRLDHRNELWFVTPQDGNRFLAIYATESESPGAKAGINEKGLCIVGAAPSSLAKKLRLSGKPGLIETLLKSCGSLEEILKRKKLFSEFMPDYYLMADRSGIMLVEIAPEGKYFICQTSNGVLFHTNHYVYDEFAGLNTEPNDSSLVRLGRLAFLLENQVGPFTMDDFITFSEDRHDGPDNSIFRTGSTPKKPCQVASWTAAIPRDGAPPDIYVKLRNPNEADRSYRMKLDEAFWTGTSGGWRNER